MVLNARTVKLGLMVGLIGYASVALFYALFDLLAARGGLYTVNLLGEAVFRGLRDPGVLGLPIKLDVGGILWYNALHFVVSLVIGLIVTWLVEVSERRRALSQIIFLVIIGGFVVTILAVGSLTDSIRPLLPWWSIVVANALAVIFAGTYLVRKRPGLWHRMTTLRR